MCHVTSDAMKIEPKAVVKHYCVWFDFHCIRRYLSSKLDSTLIKARKVDADLLDDSNQI